MGVRSAGRRHWVVGLAAVLLLGAGLRTYSALTEAIEVDELFTRDVVSGSVHAGVAMVLDDRYHPPLHYVLAKLFSVVSGTSPEELRLASVLSGIALVACAAFLTRALFADISLALLAGLLVALSDWQILVSHYARSYALFDLLVLLAGAALWKACETPLDKRFWVAFVMAGGAVVNTNYVGWLYLVSVLPAVALCGTRVLKRWLLASGVVVLTFVPWTLLLAWYARRRGGFAGKFAHLDFRPRAGALLNAFAQLNGLPAATWWAAGLTILFGGLLVGFAVATAVRRRKEADLASQRAGVLIMASLAVLPPLALWLVTRPPLSLPLWGFRQLTPSIAPWILVTCAGVSLARGKALLRPALAASLVALQGVTTVTNTVHGRLVPFHTMARLFAEKPSGSRIVYIVGTPPWRALIQYYLPPSDSVETLPDTDTALPRSFWLVYRPADEAEEARVAALLSRGWSVSLFQDFEKRGGDRGIVRAARIVGQGTPPRGATPQRSRAAPEQDRRPVVRCQAAVTSPLAAPGGCIRLASPATGLPRRQANGRARDRLLRRTRGQPPPMSAHPLGETVHGVARQE